MAVNQKAAWLLAYDIRNRRRLGRLHRFLRKIALPVQYSVFFLRASPSDVGRLVPDIEDLIDPAEDDVRIYRIPEPALVTVKGRCILPTDVLLLDVGSGLFSGDVTDQI